MGKSKHKNDDHLSSSLYESMMSQFLHQDRLVWDMAQLIVVIQGGVLASSYSLRSYWIAPIILAFGVILSIVILILVVKCEIDRDVNKLLLNKLAVYLIPKSIKAELEENGIQEPYVCAGGSLPKWLKFVRGRYIIRFVFISFIVIDLFLMVSFIFMKDLFNFQ